MKKKIKFILVLIFSLSLQFSIKADDDLIDPEPYFGSPNSDQKFFRATDIIVVTANDYATTVGYQILENGGTVFDAAVSIQMILGLVEPQSSGIGGGTFVTFFDNKSKKTFSYEGRETAPYNIPNDLFLDENQKPKKFFSAAVGGLSVGVPATLKTFYELHKDFGKMEWKSLLEPAIKLSKIGFEPHILQVKSRFDLMQLPCFWFLS